MSGGQGDMKKRLVRFATEHLGITVHRFEKSCGLSNSYCSNPNVVGSYAKKKIIQAYPELNMDWVITGTGSMLKGEELKKNNKNIVKENHITQVKEDADVYGKMNEEIVALRRELELYKMLYEKEHKDVKDLSEQVGALKAEIDNLKKGENCSETESASVKKKRKAS
jgi:hypothetical protein